jgi:hypothetical protein
LIYRSHLGFLVFLLSALLIVSLVDDGTARPEFAAMEDKECSFCHLDPAGGGPRNAIGQVYEDNYFEFPEDFDPETIMAEAEEVRQRLTTAVDIRTAYIKTAHVDLEGRERASCTSCHSSVDSFLLMQGELTVNAQASDKLRLTLSNNMGSPLNMFATVDAIPKHLYVKVGQFRIPFGLKQRDHNILVRQGYNLGSHKRDVGVEVGGTYGKLFYNAAVVNGNRSAGQAVDSNQHKGWVATAGSTLGSVRGGVTFLLDRDRDLDREMIAGAFLTAVYKNLTLEGEFNFGGSFGEEESIGFSNDDITSKGYYFGAKYRVMPELMLSGRYGLFDGDRTLKGDGSQRVTLAAQYIFMQNGSLELFYWLNIANEDRDEATADRQLEGVDQLILMSHFWF